MQISEQSQFQIVSLDSIVISDVAIREAQDGKDNKYFDSLLASIKQQGVQVPVRLRLYRDENGEVIPNKWWLTDGAQRHKCAEILGITQIPALIVEETDDEAMGSQLFVNRSRVPQTKLQERNQIKMLMAQNPTWDRGKVAHTCGMAETELTTLLGLDRLNTEAMTLFESGELKPTKAIYLSRVPTEIQDQLVGPALKDNTEDFRKLCLEHIKEHKKQNTPEGEDVIVPRPRKKDDLVIKFEELNHRMESTDPGHADYPLVTAEYLLMKWIMQVDDKTLSEHKKKREDAKAKRSENKSLEDIQKAAANAKKRYEELTAQAEARAPSATSESLAQ